MGQPGRRLDLPRSHRFMLAALSGLGAVDRCTASSSRRHFSSSRRAGAGQGSQGKGRRIPQPAHGLLETTRVRFSCGRWASPIVFHCSSTGQVFGTVFCRVLPRGCVTFGAFIVLTLYRWNVLFSAATCCRSVTCGRRADRPSCKLRPSWRQDKTEPIRCTNQTNFPTDGLSAPRRVRNDQYGTEAASTTGLPLASS